MLSDWLPFLIYAFFAAAIPATMIMVQLGIRVSQFYQHESCGKCTPCRVGTKWLTEILQKIEDGRGAQSDMELDVDTLTELRG